MTSRTTESFRKLFEDLPPEVKVQAISVYRKWKSNPQHPGLQFKRIHSANPIYSVRISLHWRALADVQDDSAVWFWIGSHSEYDRLVKAFNRS